MVANPSVYMVILDLSPFLMTETSLLSFQPGKDNFLQIFGS